MTWITAILGFLQITPSLLDLIKQLMTYLNTISGNDPKGLIVKTGAAMAMLNQAKTEDDRKAAAKAIADAIQGL